ncbi:maleylpyruvate isomerase family mycothiol-dependent enzyme [Actinomadura syzygii]|uniref:Maleylpyruvate isomerase family mycothiol-dependent enzyme n=1 Tax=Actinomadura syzygii TaxID=1427538 RepID=A0A5D0TXA5_9ACTN|nr:maleylpyruvate isomerase family mycothiol-dependent enzyme [Actinomadura syzygii]TYC09975.1 maleylpyruvate isomerase family mycothiol-dependent enzyme [Actinomadura syzygii]
MTGVSFERYRDELVAQTDAVREMMKGADLRAGVPSCPGWNLGQLLGHIGGDHHWAAEVVRTRAAGPVPDEMVNDLAEYRETDLETLDGWLAEGAAELADALRDAAPDTPVWSPSEDHSAGFWARRMLYETVVHRADAALTIGAEFTLAADLAVDALDEWMGYSVYEEATSESGLIGPGRTLHFHATDSDEAAEWVVDLSTEPATWRRAHEKSAVAVRGALTDLLLFVYRRPGLRDRVDVVGDEELLDLWLERAGFWLEAE